MSKILSEGLDKTILVENSKLIHGCLPIVARSQLVVMLRSASQQREGRAR